MAHDALQPDDLNQSQISAAPPQNGMRRRAFVRALGGVAQAPNDALCQSSRSDGIALRSTQGPRSRQTMRILVSARLQATAAPEAPAPMISTSRNFFTHFADRGSDQRLIKRIFGACDRLPEAGFVRAFDQQHPQIRGMNDDEDGFGDFVGGHK
mgnify:CR=1 FL=1